MNNDDITRGQRIFNIIGWIGFIFMIPVLLNLLGIKGPSTWLETYLGFWLNTATLIAWFFIFQVARTIFGSARIISPLIIGAVVSFLIIAATIPFGFMAWFYNLLQPSTIFAGRWLSLSVGLFVIILGYLLSYKRRLHPLVQVVVLIIIPVSFLIFSKYAGLYNVITW